VRFDNFTAIDLTPQPTVTVEIHGQKLLISGEEATDVSIVAISDNTVQIVQHGQVLATHTVRCGNLRVEMSGGDDHLTLDLGGLTALRHVTIDLGHGENSLLVTNGQIGGHLKVLGGTGGDTVEIARDAVITRHVQVKLAGGENMLSVSGEIHRNLWVKTGAGDDTVLLDGTVKRHVFAHLGEGDNHAEISPDADLGKFVFFGVAKGGASWQAHDSRDEHHRSKDKDHDRHKHTHEQQQNRDEHPARGNHFSQSQKSSKSSSPSHKRC
jgi:hypothetical protein